MSRGAIGVKSKWARLRDDVNVRLRRGMWYRVLDEGELAQMMHVAQCLGEAVALIAHQAVMDAGATELLSNANGIQSGAPSARMRCVVSESLG